MREFSVLLFSLMLASAAGAQTSDWKKSWDETLAAARKEGKVVVSGPPSPELRQALPAAFKQRYGIALEFLAGRGSETATKLRAEHQAGAMTVDVIIAGIQTMATILYREKMLDPVRAALVLPEVTDGSKWKTGKLWFSDPDDQYVLRLSNTVSPTFYINTGQVKPGDLRTTKDLLDPKWKGRIALQDPTVPGSGSNHGAQLYLQLGEDFVKKLYIDQSPAISRDTRQITDWVARGSYAISLGGEDQQVEQLRKEGIPIATLNLSDTRQLLSAGFGELALLRGAPHPNAAKIFLNWMASKEGGEIFARALTTASTRNDVEESFLPPGVVPQAGGSYFDTYDWEFTVTTKEQVRLRMKELLGSR
jgi:iron(III) transport system substrate-binding protein